MSEPYDIIFVTGEYYFDHPLCGVAILKRLLEKQGYRVGVIEKPVKEEDVTQLGTPKLFFGVTSGAIDSMVRNYTALKKERTQDEYSDYEEEVIDRATTVFSNWIKKNYKESKIVLGGTEASLRRFTHYDYWENRLRKPILIDTRADILAYGSAEKQILEIAKRIQHEESLLGIEGTCIVTKEIPVGFLELPSFDEVTSSKEKFCDMQNGLYNYLNLAQKIDTRYIIQYKFPNYTPADLDSYYDVPFTRNVPKALRGFEFSVVTHRGCIGNCNFCSIRLLQGEKIVSRSEASILKEIEYITTLPHFKGNIDDLGGPSANMYGMDCHKCNRNCIDGCKNLDTSHTRLITLMRKARTIPKVKNVYVKSGIRYDLATPAYIEEIAKYHVFKTLRVAPEHTNKKVLQLMNKDKGNLKWFITEFKKHGKELSYYFMTAHPGSSMKETRELANELKRLQNTESVQIFTPTPMTVSTCMYYTGLDPSTKNPIYVPYTYKEKKEQKRILYGEDKSSTTECC